jgi:hypothetical protein
MFLAAPDSFALVESLFVVTSTSLASANSYDKIIRKFGMKKYINLNVIIILKHVDRHVFVTLNLV